MNHQQLTNQEVETVETIKLTKEQSEVLEKMRNCHHLRNDKDALLVKHAAGWMNAYQILNEIPMLDFAQLVLNEFAYEIEPEQPKLKRCDKVVRVDGDTFAGFNFIETVEEDIGYGRYRLENGFVYTEDFIKLATPEEIFWLEELKRKKVGDFRIGDIFIQYDGQGFGIDTSGLLDRAYCMYAAGNFQGLHPADSFRLFKKEPE